MKGLIKLIIGLVLLVIVLVVAGGAFLGLFFNPNEYKPEIEKIALEKAGVQLKINGDIGWSVFPWLGLELNSIDAKFPDKPELATLNKAQVSVQLIPLISGEITMNEIVVDGLSLNLVKEKNGSDNWSSTQQQGVATATTEDSSGESADSSSELALNISGIVVRNSHVSYQDKVTDTEIVLNDFSFSTDEIKPETFIPVTAGFNLIQKVKGKQQANIKTDLTTDLYFDLVKQQYKLQKLSSNISLKAADLPKPVELNVGGDVDINLAGQHVNLKGFVFKLANMEANAEIKLEKFAAPEIVGTISIATFNVKELLSALGMPAIETKNPDALSAVGLDMKLKGTATKVSAESLVVKLDKTTLTGIAFYGINNQQITLNLNGDTIDIDAYLPPTSEQKQQQAAAAGDSSGSSGYSTDPILPVKMLKTLRLNARFALNKLHVSNMDMAKVMLNVTAKDGLINADKINVDLYSGTVRSSVKLDVRKPTPVIHTSKKISSVQVGDALQAVTGDTPPITGALSSQSNLTIRGNSVHDFVNSLTGNVKVNIKDGIINGIDMAQQACQTANNISSLGMNTKEVDGSTPFANMGLSTQINNGVVRNEDLKAVLDAINLTGRGIVNLPKQELDYRVGLTVDKNLFKETCSFPDKLEGIEIPLKCRGSFNTEPAKLCKPDLSFLREMLKKKTKERYQEQIDEKKEELRQEAKEKLGGKLRGLLGR